MDRILPPRGRALDAAIAALMAGVGLFEVLVRPLAEDVVSGPLWLNLVAVLAGTVPLAWRRRQPFGVAIAVYAALAVRALGAEPLELYPTSIALLVATYTVASYAPLRDALLSAAFSTLALAVAVVRGSGTAATPDPLPSAILLGTVWLVGRVVGVRNERARALLQTRDEHAAEAVVAERARIARELHDVVSHSLAAIVMQSGGAMNVLDTDPERARSSLAAIERAAREGLEEMRRMLGLLGDEEPGVTLPPQPGLARVDDLVEAVRGTGLGIDCRVTGEPRALPAAVDVSAYRVLQEALTNVMRHADARTVRVEVRYLPGELELEVTDDGVPGAVDSPGEPQDAGGRGLAGMRERVRLLGGSVDTGPRVPGPGFRVRARMPA